MSDLIYVKVGLEWNYGTIVDLRKREVLGHSCGPNKTAELVSKAFASITGRLGVYDVVHTQSLKTKQLMIY
ncbi:hypothetical protein AwErysi_10110 [Erysipelotrichaceae bacterium]|nr:hypothetical protein AwErysi_10110 [Erysipelotrichaceae bacterium]